MRQALVLALSVPRWAEHLPGRRNEGRQMTQGSGQPGAGPQLAGTDSDHQNAGEAADQRVGEAGLDPGAGVCACQAAGAECDARGPAGGHRAVLVD